MDPRFREGDGGIIPLVIENTAKLSAIAPRPGGDRAVFHPAEMYTVSRTILMVQLPAMTRLGEIR
jgi:hypothetical protein